MSDVDQNKVINVKDKDVEYEDSCEYGYEGCEPDGGDPESMCEQHLLEAGERHAEGMQETFDL